MEIYALYSFHVKTSIGVKNTNTGVTFLFRKKLADVAKYPQSQVLKQFSRYPIPFFAYL